MNRAEKARIQAIYRNWLIGVFSRSGMSYAELGRRMDQHEKREREYWPRQRANQLVLGKKPITAETVDTISSVLGVRPPSLDGRMTPIGTTAIVNIGVIASNRWFERGAFMEQSTLEVAGDLGSAGQEWHSFQIDETIDDVLFGGRSIVLRPGDWVVCQPFVENALGPGAQLLVCERLKTGMTEDLVQWALAVRQADGSLRSCQALPADEELLPVSVVKKLQISSSL